MAPRKHAARRRSSAVKKTKSNKQSSGGQVTKRSAGRPTKNFLPSRQPERCSARIARLTSPSGERKDLDPLQVAALAAYSEEEVSRTSPSLASTPTAVGSPRSPGPASTITAVGFVGSRAPTARGETPDEASLLVGDLYRKIYEPTNGNYQRLTRDEIQFLTNCPQETQRAIALEQMKALALTLRYGHGVMKPDWFDHPCLVWVLDGETMRRRTMMDDLRKRQHEDRTEHRRQVKKRRRDTLGSGRPGR